MLEFKRAVVPLVAPMQRLATDQAGLPLDPRTADYFRDVNDHLTRDVEQIAAFDELLTGVLQANFAQLTVRDNQDLRKISSWVAIAAVPTMIFGLYGMNFEHMPELEWQYGYPLILFVVLAHLRRAAPHLQALRLALERRSGSRPRRRCGCSGARRPGGSILRRRLAMWVRSVAVSSA